MQSENDKTFSELCQEITKGMSEISVSMRELQANLSNPPNERKDLAELIDRIQAAEKEKFFTVYPPLMKFRQRFTHLGFPSSEKLKRIVLFILFVLFLD